MSTRFGSAGAPLPHGLLVGAPSAARTAPRLRGWPVFLEPAEQSVRVGGKCRHACDHEPAHLQTTVLQDRIRARLHLGRRPHCHRRIGVLASHAESMTLVACHYQRRTLR